MEFIDPNYEPPVANNNESFANGDYMVKGINWFSRDSQTHQPILVAQKNGLVGRLYFKLTDDRKGPPMSLSLGDMGLLAKAFGVANPPPTPAENQPGLISNYMTQIETMVNDLNKVLTVKVEGGWVNNSGVPGMEVPKGNFYFVLSDVTPKDKVTGLPFWTQGKFGPIFFAEFTVVAGEGGQPTSYKGATFSELMPYEVEVQAGKPVWKTNDEGKPVRGAKILSDLMRMTAPEMNFQPEDPTNILKTWYRQLPKPFKVLKGSRVRNDKNGRIQLVWDTVEPVYNFYSETTQAPQQEEDIHQKARKILVRLFDQIIEKPSTNGTTEFNEHGIILAKKIISPLKQKGLVKGKNLRDLSWEDVDQIITSMKADYPVGSFYDELVSVGIRLDQLEQEDTPF